MVGKIFINHFVNFVRWIFKSDPLRHRGGGIYVTGCCCRLSAGGIRETTGAVAILPSVSVSTQNGGNGSGSALRSAEDM